MEKNKFTCKNCNHIWVPKKLKPKRCPSCQRTDWMPNSGATIEDRAFPGIFRG